MTLERAEELHKAILLPVVRVRAGNAGGSGTVIYSHVDTNGEWSTYVLTNQHVVDNIIKVEEKWSTLLKRNVKVDVMGTPEVHHFNYRWKSRATGANAIESDIVAYDKDEDLALLRLRSTEPVPAVAKMYPKGAEDKLRLTMAVFAVGAGLGEPPLATNGLLAGFGREIEHREFWTSTAPPIFGNSGGALFLADTCEFIGVPARIAVTGFGYQAITHLSYAIPITRVYKFLEEQMFEFIYDSTHTEDGDAKRRMAARKREERQVARDESTGNGNDVLGPEDFGIN